MRAAATAAACFGLQTPPSVAEYCRRISLLLTRPFVIQRRHFRVSTSSVDDSRIELTDVSQTAPTLNWELDDWEFGGYGLEEEPRLVFGHAPTLEESKEATSELRDALDKYDYLML